MRLRELESLCDVCNVEKGLDRGNTSLEAHLMGSGADGRGADAYGHRISNFNQWTSAVLRQKTL